MEARNRRRWTRILNAVPCAVIATVAIMFRHCSTRRAITTTITGSRCTTSVDASAAQGRWGHGWGHRQQRGFVVFRGQYAIVELVLGSVRLRRRFDVHEGNRRTDADDEPIATAVAAAATAGSK